MRVSGCHRLSGGTDRSTEELEVSAATLYNWRRASGGMDLNAAKELLDLREQNTWLKRLLADRNHWTNLLEARVAIADPTAIQRWATSPRPHKYR